MNDENGAGMRIGEKLKNYRLINFLTQEALAETSGISIRTLQRIEEGKSIGSAYTLNAIAKALNINSTDLIINVSLNSHNINQLKILNLSAIAILLIPLTNVVFPACIYWKNKDDVKIKNIGGKIISFHILWTLGTMLMVLIIPVILLLLFPLLKGSSIPLFRTCIFCNRYFQRLLYYSVCNQH